MDGPPPTTAPTTVSSTMMMSMTKERIVSDTLSFTALKESGLNRDQARGRRITRSVLSRLVIIVVSVDPGFKLWQIVSRVVNVLQISTMKMNKLNSMHLSPILAEVIGLFGWV